MPEQSISGLICEVCSALLWFDENYDALFCPICNEWREDPCGKKSCEYCPSRPERPLPLECQKEEQ